MDKIKQIVVLLSDGTKHEVKFLEPKTSDQVEDHLEDIFRIDVDYTWTRK